MTALISIMVKTMAFLLFLSLADGYRILGIFPHSGKSHYDSFEPLMKALASKGHEVTALSNFPQKTPVPNMTDIDISSGPILFNALSLGDLTGARYEKYLTPLILANLGYNRCHDGLPVKSLQDFIKSEPKFDVIIAEFFSNQCFLGLAHKIKAPVVGLSSCIIMSWHDHIMGVTGNPAYIPNTFMPFTPHMDFFERVENTALYLFHKLVYQLFMELPGNWAAKKYLGDDTPDLKEIEANVSMMLVNNHFTYTNSRPMVPGYVEVAGMHIEKAKKLPANIEKWINESPHGVIYFSMGSLIKGHTFPEEKRQMFLRAFGRLPQRVLWKWETETMPGKPENVMLQKWMPQFDILSHPNVKAFISHGGLLGTTEAVHCGVPMVIMPQFGDQFTNAKAIEASGGGVILNFRDLDEESVYNALTMILDPSFNKKAKELSARFRDRPMPPLETAIYWVEYVARHGGAPHLRTAAVGMPLYQYLLLDVVAFVAVILLIITYVSYRITKAILRRIFKSNSSPKVKKS